MSDLVTVNHSTHWAFSCGIAIFYPPPRGGRGILLSPRSSGCPSVRPSVRASTFIAVSAITHKLFAISIWNLSHTCTTWKGRTLLILGVARSKMADWGGHLEKNVFCNKWKTAYLISIIFGYYVPHPWITFWDDDQMVSCFQFTSLIIWNMYDFFHLMAGDSSSLMVYFSHCCQ